MCFGPFKKICHWGPLSVIGILKCVTGMTMYCSKFLWSKNGLEGFLHTICFTSLAGLTIYNLLSAISQGPGYVPTNWEPEDVNATQYLQFCVVCQSYKAPRSHHCQKCGRCILKMDHHCPWINNCVGWANHGHFLAFLTFSTLGCIYATSILGTSLYRSLYRSHYMNMGKFVHFGIYGTIMCVLSLGFSIGVIIAVGMLWFFQVRGIIRNRTAVEDWILEKADYRRRREQNNFIFPYDLGILNNIKQVVNLTCHPTGNGIEWQVAENCDQYTLTKEQLQQKSEKRIRSREYTIFKPASGRWFPISYGVGTCVHPPCTDESRIKLEVDDTVVVTRWRKYWLFGERINLENLELTSQRQRGWFPRACVDEVSEEVPPPPSQARRRKKLQ